MVGFGTLARLGIVHAYGEVAVPCRQSVRSGIGAEVAVKGPVLLHDYDYVLDLMNARMGPGGRGAECTRSGCVSALSRMCWGDSRRRLAVSGAARGDYQAQDYKQR